MEENENKENMNKENVIEEENDGVIETEDEVELANADGLKISKDAVATYAGIAISEVRGVYNMSGGLAGFTEAISRKEEFFKRN